MPDRKSVLVYHSEDIETYKRLLGPSLPEADFHFCQDLIEINPLISTYEIAFVPYTFPQKLFKKMRNLKWVQVMAAGVEHFVRNAAQFNEIVVTRMVGVDARYMAEYVLAYMLYFSQKMAKVIHAQHENKWEFFLPEFIFKKTCGIMGLGAIGSVVAKKSKAAGMRVVSWDLRHREAPFVDKQYIAEELHDFLQEVDYVVVVLPVTKETVNMINKDIFRRMKTNACLINICRGELVDEDALCDALKQEEIAGAVIDVVKDEPLPSDNKLWDCPNLIITPHISGVGLSEDMAVFFEENFKRYIRKEPLAGVVDFQKGF